MIRVIDGTATIENEIYNNWASTIYCSQGELIFKGPVISRDPATTRKLTVAIDYGKFNPDGKTSLDVTLSASWSRL